MINPDQLSPEQIQSIRTWAEEGLDLNAIQKRLHEDLNIKLTFMDTRFLLQDLDIRIRQPEPESEAEQPGELPGTMPPPNTLSNSSMPVPILSSFSMDTWESLAGSAFSPAWPGLADDPAFLPPDTTRSSTIEFHALQPGHCPIHFADSYPHS